MVVKKEKYFIDKWIQEFRYMDSFGYCYIQMYIDHENSYVINFQKTNDCKIVKCVDYVDAKAKFILAVKNI